MQELIEVYPVRLSLEEGASGKVVIKGPFGHCANPTSNGRLYKQSLMEREFKRLSEAMGRRRLFGELDHPDDGKTSLKRVSHIVTNLRIDESGEVFGELEPLPTPMGEILKALAKAGCELGVSSRGRGSVITREDGVDEVQDDFQLKTYDVVDNPASKNAFPSLAESDEEINSFIETLDEEHREDVRRAYKEAAEKIDTFTLEDIKDEELKCRVAEALGLEEACCDACAADEEGSDEGADVDEADTSELAESLRPGTLFVVVDISKPGGKMVSDIIRGVKKADAEAARLTAKGKNVQVIDAKWYVPALRILQAQGIVPKDESDESDLESENARLREALAGKIEELHDTVRDDIRKAVEADVRGELLSDPEVSGARTVLEQVATLIRPLVGASDPEVDRLRRENVALMDAVKDRDFRLANERMEAAAVKRDASARLMEAHLVTSLGRHPKADAIRKMIGPLHRFESEDELNERLIVAFDVLGKPEDHEADAIAAVRAENEAAIEALHGEYKARVEALEGKIDRLTEAVKSRDAKLEESVEIAEEIDKARLRAQEEADALKVRLHIYERTVSRADRLKLIAMCESAESVEDVDRILSSAPTRSPSEITESMDDMRDRLRRSSAGRAREVLSESGRNHKKGDTLVDEGFEVDLNEAVALAGVSGN